MQQSTLSLV